MSDALKHGGGDSALRRACMHGLRLRSRRRYVLFTILTIALLVALTVSAGMGQYAISPADMVASILRRIGAGYEPSDPQAYAV